MSIVLFGSTGMIGSDFEALDIARPKIDCCNRELLLEYFSKEKPIVVINCVGVCGGECEASPIKAHELNVTVPLNLAIACNLFNTKLIHITSSTAGYGNMYTVSKHYAEELISRICRNVCIAEIPWMFAKNNDKGFLTTVCNCLDKELPIPVYDNEVGTPTYAKDVAEYIINNLDIMFDYVTIANQGSATRREWATEIAEIRGITDIMFIEKERSIPINPYSFVIGPLRNWREALRACICDKGFLLQS